MAVKALRDRTQLEACLRRDPELHLYALGDLDDFFWSDTTWYGSERHGLLRDVILIYAGQSLPTVVAMGNPSDGVARLLRRIAPKLPPRFHAHFSPGVQDVLDATHRVDPRGTFYRMALRDRSRVGPIDGSDVRRLGREDLKALLRFYDRSYPGNWFDPRMLDTGQYFGLRVDGRLVSVAGVHVYSERYRVAALGNIVTRPDRRNQGYGTRATARLCRSLLETIDHIGLNVKTDNDAALRCYRKLGFETVASYGEFNASLKE
jgi:ribosomal protein S18 acetylase RimI-like enzyme